MTPPLLDNILSQPRSLRQVTDHQFGEGRAALEAAAGALRGASRIVLSGMGSSLFSCLPLEAYFNERGVPAIAIDTSELLHYRSAICGPGTAVVLVSRSGESVEALRLVEKLYGSEVKLIGVTNEAGSSLERAGENSILIRCGTDQLVAVQSYSGTVAALLLLGAAYSDELEKSRAGLTAASDELERLGSQCAAASEMWREFFEPARTVYLLGRGHSVASSLEGSLLFHEAAKTPAVGMTVAQFRHGPVEVVDKDFRGIVFASQARTAHLDSAFARELAELGAQIFPIGPFAERSISWNREKVPEIFAPLLEIVPVQLAALRLAQWKGLIPGEFRFAASVTRSETGFFPPRRRES